MAIQTINVGSAANSGGGDPLRLAMIKINENFTEVYGDVANLKIVTGTSGATGGTLAVNAVQGDLIGQDSSIIVDSSNNTVKGDFIGSVFADDSTVLIDGVGGTINAGALTGALPAIDGSALTGITVSGIAFSAVTGTPTTLSGYGIADAYTQTQVDTAISNATSSIVIPAGSTQSVDVVAADSTVLVDSVNGTLNATTLTGALPAIDGSALTGVTTAFSNITSTPTTLAGYGITDALTTGGALTGTGLEAEAVGAGVADGNDLAISGGDATETNSTGGDANITGGSGALTSGNVNIGASQTTLVTIGSGSNNVDFPSGTTVDFTGATVNGLTVTETDPVVGAITGIVKADGSGNISAAVAGTDYLTTVAFADLTGKPTTLAGYGISDAATLNNMAPTGAVDFTGATSIDFNTVTINNLEFADISAKPTTIAGYGITDAFDGAFGSLSGTPTSLGGYGITDAASTGAETTFTKDVHFDRGVEEKFQTLTGQSGVVAHNWNDGHVFYHTTPAGDITANFINVNLTAEYATNVTIIINQGATPYEITAVQIAGSGQTINWQGGSAPTGNANGIDAFSFTILNDGGTYVVLGQMVDFT